MSISVKSGSWNWNLQFKSIPDFSKAIKQAQKAINDQLTKHIQTLQPPKQKKKVESEPSNSDQDEDEENWEEIDNIYK